MSSTFSYPFLSLHFPFNFQSSFDGSTVGQLPIDERMATIYCNIILVMWLINVLRGPDI